MHDDLNPVRIRALVSHAALRQNWRQLNALAPQAQLWPVIKADAYGHGALRVATVLDEAPGFTVAALSEAIALRESGIRAPLLVLGGVHSNPQWDYCAAEAIQVVVHNREQWEQLLAQSRAPEVWLKFDTGMGRLGFLPEDAATMAATLGSQRRGLIRGIMTHLASAEDLESTQTLRQLQCFESVIEHFPGLEVSVANSAGLLAWPQTRRGLIRPGLALYGVDPLHGAASPAGVDLQPVLRLEARVMAIKAMPAGSGIGYGASWRCPADTTLAIIAAGYADGVRRGLENTGYRARTRQGVSLPLRGHISMDTFCVELPEPTAVAIGDWIGLWGAGATPVAQVASYLDTIPYELLTALGGRVSYQDAP